MSTDSEIKNKPIVTRGEVGGDNGGKRGRGFQKKTEITFLNLSIWWGKLLSVTFALYYPAKIFPSEVARYLTTS